MMCKIQWAKQHDVIRPSNSSRFHLGNRAKTFIGQNFPARIPRSRETSLPALSYELIKNFINKVFKASSHEPG